MTVTAVGASARLDDALNIVAQPLAAALDGARAPARAMKAFVGKSAAPLPRPFGPTRAAGIIADSTRRSPLDEGQTKSNSSPLDLGEPFGDAKADGIPAPTEVLGSPRRSSIVGLPEAPLGLDLWSDRAAACLPDFRLDPIARELDRLDAMVKENSLNLEKLLGVVGAMAGQVEDMPEGDGGGKSTFDIVHDLATQTGDVDVTKLNSLFGHGIAMAMDGGKLLAEAVEPKTVAEAGLVARAARRNLEESLKDVPFARTQEERDALTQSIKADLATIQATLKFDETQPRAVPMALGLMPNPEYDSGHLEAPRLRRRLYGIIDQIRNSDLSPDEQGAIWQALDPQLVKPRGQTTLPESAAPAPGSAGKPHASLPSGYAPTSYAMPGEQPANGDGEDNPFMRSPYAPRSNAGGEPLFNASLKIKIIHDQRRAWISTHLEREREHPDLDLDLGISMVEIG